jgi:hypothetical protein
MLRGLLVVWSTSHTYTLVASGALPTCVMWGHAAEAVWVGVGVGGLGVGLGVRVGVFALALCYTLTCSLYLLRSVVRVF